ncbi:hypothetical protein CONLIGDRAFT_662915 [Coniochaeta ligniaria NRRL 30616]|uniref:Glycosyltransferase family 25 protein n=1 Tax=Coniochaeta ligniaria NRRL 30616 TaxID=1408157 RepID=A0A1J7JFL5_9PEZI|nr:hypothetical protein CONLIGDRAFT_662915 [Coniochaeta ligniaria NRRL 30616]
MVVLRPRPALLAGAVLLAVLTILYLSSSHSSTYLPKFTLPPRVTNATLGFARVFAVGLPERSDKRDALALASALTGFRVDWISGVRGESIPDKAVPLGVDRKKLMETNLGSWRGHMDAVRRIVEEGLESALVLEDDMDWDVRLKPLLEVVAAGVRSVKPSSPYGDDWDVLWLGHCGEPFPEDLPEPEIRGLGADDPARVAMGRKFTVLNDATVPPRERVTGLVNFTRYAEHTRWVHVTAAPICTFAYALSQRGARKVLFDLSVDGLRGPFDNALAGLCRRAEGGDRGLDAKCFSVTPPVFFHHKARGPVSADSDIQVVEEDGRLKETGEGKVREKGTTENIVWSARLNVRNMLMGLEMESQW